MVILLGSRPLGSYCTDPVLNSRSQVLEVHVGMACMHAHLRYSGPSKYNLRAKAPLFRGLGWSTKKRFRGVSGPQDLV